MSAFRSGVDAAPTPAKASAPNRNVERRSAAQAAARNHAPKGKGAGGRRAKEDHKGRGTNAASGVRRDRERSYVM